MLTAAMLLLANTLLFSLRLSNTGSFPKPLSAAEEREWLDRYAQGDPEARDVLIEHNLRLVTHIIKKWCSKVQRAVLHNGPKLFGPFSDRYPCKHAALCCFSAR